MEILIEPLIINTEVELPKLDNNNGDPGIQGCGGDQCVHVI